MRISNEVVLPRLLTAREVAQATGLALARVYELTRRGEVPHVRFGRSVRYDADVMIEWLRAGGTRADGDGAS